MAEFKVRKRNPMRQRKDCADDEWHESDEIDLEIFTDLVPIRIVYRANEIAKFLKILQFDDIKHETKLKAQQYKESMVANVKNAQQ